ncbi:MAG: glycosyltransferase [Thermoanaerobaculia bacterium]
MKLAVFGLTVTSSFGNGHATLWRGLCRGLDQLGHRVVFFEKDVSYYARHRDVEEVPGCELVLYRDWEEVRPRAETAVGAADAAMVTSYCPDALAATALARRSPLAVFYDMDTPVTLRHLARGEEVPWVGPRGLAEFDLVLSFTGGRSLAELRDRLGARRLAPLYGSVDPESHRPVPADPDLAGDLSYLGTYAADRQEGVERLFLEPARRRPERRFVLGGSLYPETIDWPGNVLRVRHVPPPRHPAFYCSSPATLNVTRGPMAENGYCPSGRLFEAAACGVPVVSDVWPGLETFFEPGREILLARSTDDVVGAVELGPERLARIGAAARERVLAEHTARRRAEELVALLESPLPEPRRVPRGETVDGRPEAAESARRRVEA